MKDFFCARVLENNKLAESIFDLRLSCPKVTAEAEAGQFLSIYTGSPAMLLPRALSICEINKGEGSLRIVYRIAGEGTKAISAFKSGDNVKIIAPLGNAFKVDAGKKITIVGGGIGSPPLLELAKKVRRNVPDSSISVFLGFRSVNEVILKQDFAECADYLSIATNDGSCGTKGTVMDLLESSATPEIVYACGPHIMLKNVAAWAEKGDIPCYVSMEERMACTVGACLACVVKVRQNGEIIQKTVCANGPVFDSKELVWE